MMGTTILVNPDRGAIAERAMDLLIDGLRAGIRQRGVAHLALTGGSSAKTLFERLRRDRRARRVDWARVHVWQGDERFVSLDHPDRNWAAALRDWLTAHDAPPIPPGQLHPIPVDEAIAAGQDAAAAAAAYSEVLERELPRRSDVPAFDVLLLGVGGDGHILSTFPATAPIDERQVPALAVPAPEHIEPHVPRVTLAPFLLAAAGMIVVMVPGAGKASIVADCLYAPPDPRRWPAQLAIRPNAIWLLEEESAADL